MIYKEVRELSDCAYNLLQRWSSFSKDEESLCLFSFKKQLTNKRRKEVKNFLILNNWAAWLSFFWGKKRDLVILDSKERYLGILFLLFWAKLFRLKTAVIIHSIVNHNHSFFRRISSRVYFWMLNRLVHYFLPVRKSSESYLSVKGVSSEKIFLFPLECWETKIEEPDHSSEVIEKTVLILNSEKAIITPVLKLLFDDLASDPLHVYIVSSTKSLVTEVNAFINENSVNHKVTFLEDHDQPMIDQLKVDLSVFFYSQELGYSAFFKAFEKGGRLMVSEQYSTALEIIEPAVNGFIFPENDPKIIAEQIKLAVFHCRSDKFQKSLIKLQSLHSNETKIKTLLNLSRALKTPINA